MSSQKSSANESPLLIAAAVGLSVLLLVALGWSINHAAERGNLSITIASTR